MARSKEVETIDFVYGKAKMSSGGQLVVPASIRKAVGAEGGDSFFVIKQSDCIVLKKIEATPAVEIRRLLTSAARAVTKAKNTKAALDKVLKTHEPKKKVASKKRRRNG